MHAFSKRGGEGIRCGAFGEAEQKAMAYPTRPYAGEISRFTNLCKITYERNIGSEEDGLSWICEGKVWCVLNEKLFCVEIRQKEPSRFDAL
ncbi:hypothetical protein M5K25_005050 [Dendrobium thyrsiflorum]|uniref:Uncharacterized protein n=1 Tax=Dendrobium thyrsiflorum TaxID=117978 RepID=A0ABD0VGH1_DENTH